MTIFSDDGSKAVQLDDEQADWKPTKLLHVHKGDLMYTYYCMLHTTDYHLHVHKGDHLHQKFSLQLICDEPQLCDVSG